MLRAVKPTSERLTKILSAMLYNILVIPMVTKISPWPVAGEAAAVLFIEGYTKVVLRPYRQVSAADPNQ